ncbi:hypothetical protein GLOIN_2v1598305 [Rhizophagus clarus]|uniref:Uncharacterized protein n=1 Tax=Rhizophagus clarus TaxID=94130 RepID=A0A8H3LHT8_9GLOM|nr:hypothetical protein GLOIN_2v1598305 [Rhizophagus clarus]
MCPTCPSSEVMPEVIKSEKDWWKEDPRPENLEEEASENETSNFLQLYDKIDSTESKNEDASQGLIYSYFDLGKAVFKRYKELKLEHV